MGSPIQSGATEWSNLALGGVDADELISSPVIAAAAVEGLADDADVVSVLVHPTLRNSPIVIVQSVLAQRIDALLIVGGRCRKRSR
ncbi:MAG: hypothetical protein WKF57_06610 [Nakamurella sp.]